MQNKLARNKVESAADLFTVPIPTSVFKSKYKYNGNKIKITLILKTTEKCSVQSQG